MSLPGSQDHGAFPTPAPGQLPQTSRALPQIHSPGPTLHLILFLGPGLGVISLQKSPAYLVPPNCLAPQSDFLPGTCRHTVASRQRSEHISPRPTPSPSRAEPTPYAPEHHTTFTTPGGRATRRCSRAVGRKKCLGQQGLVLTLTLPPPPQDKCLPISRPQFPHLGNAPLF